MFWDYFVLVLYAIGMVAIAFLTRNRSGSVNDFLLAGKKGLNGWMTAFAYGTTYFSAVIFIGYAGQFGRAFGLASVWIGVGNAVIGTALAWLVLAKRTKNMTQRLQAKTMPDFYEKRYGSPRLKVVTALVIFLFLIPYSASVYNGLSSLFEIVFGIPGWAVMIGLAVLTALYLFFGGYFATALSDFIQGIIMIVGVVLMLICYMNSPEVNWDISEIANDPQLTWFVKDSGSTRWIYDRSVSFLSLVLLTSLGVWALPQTVHKYYAVRDKKAITQGIVVSTAFALIIGFIAYFSGALSPLFGQEAIVNAPDSEVIPQMLKLVIPVGLTGVIAVLILSASMSTLSSVSLASASVVAVDLYKGAINKNADDKKVNLWMRVLCLVFVAVSVILAILNEKFNIAAIAYLMGLSWGTLAGCFMGPFVLGVAWKRVSRPAVWASVISSLVLTAALILVFGYDKNGWSCSFGTALKSGIGASPTIGVICMLFSLVITVVVSLCTKAPEEQVLYNSFEQPIENEIV
ncbi:MAG: sodium:solute symporter family protein [Ruminococcaceae bacterium]|nr:sodium:solute symporter family protein [Oscillospiraceae bacterium]